MTVEHTWSGVAEALERAERDASVAIHKASIAHPLAAGLRSTIGVPRGQLADYLLSRSPTSWIHVVELDDVYEVRLINRMPATKKPRGRSRDSGALLGLVAGLALGGTAGAGLVGLLLGGLAGSASRRRGRGRGGVEHEREDDGSGREAKNVERKG